MKCPYCEEGEIVVAKIKNSGKIINICEECDTVWEDKINNQTGMNFDTYMQSKGFYASWKELEIQ